VTSRSQVSAHETAANRPLAIICGGGDFPIVLAQAAADAGRAPFLIGLVGSADARIETFDHLWLHLGEVGKFLDALRRRNIADVAAVGAIKRPGFADIRFDLGAVKRLPALTALFGGGDNRLLAGVAKLMEKEGLKLCAVHEVAPQLLAPEGALTRRAPSAEALSDARLAAAMIAALSPFDVGQAAVVARGRVLAIEAAEGTDAMLARIAELRASGRLSLRGRAGVLVKAPKRDQDMRLDLPAVGVKTIEGAQRAELEGVALAAGRVLIADRESFVRAADAAGLFVFGLEI
jgi:UDP-2,3-diacylglucosamine hydrolase